MDEKLKELLEPYEKAKLQIKESEKIIKDLQPEILKLFPGDQIVGARDGVFSIRKTKIWSYSPVHKEIEDHLKEQEIKEIAEGIATATDINTLYYTKNKVK